MITAEQVRRLWDDGTDSLIAELGETLREFGYPVTNEWVKTEITRLYNGEEAHGGPSMFIDGWLKEGIE